MDLTLYSQPLHQQVAVVVLVTEIQTLKTLVAMVVQVAVVLMQAVLLVLELHLQFRVTTVEQVQVDSLAVAVVEVQAVLEFLAQVQILVWVVMV
jgi:hypothetical protein